jgi:membrane protease YdiL (CAAX protease family)
VLIAMLSTSQTAPIRAAPSGDKLVSAIAGVGALLALYWAAVRLAERREVPKLQLRSLPADLLLGGAIGAGLMAAIIAVLWAAGWVVIGSQPISAIAIAARDSLRSGVVEEVVLRLVIFRLVWRAFGIWPALAFAAVLFGLLHLANPDAGWFAAVALICGEGIGIALYLITGRIWAPIAMHAAWNFTQGWVFGAIVSGTVDIAGGPLALRPVNGVSPLLSGGGFGPEASVAALAISSAASALLLAMAWKRGDFVPAAGPATA